MTYIIKSQTIIDYALFSSDIDALSAYLFDHNNSVLDYNNEIAYTPFISSQIVTKFKSNAI